MATPYGGFNRIRFKGSSESTESQSRKLQDAPVDNQTSGCVFGVKPGLRISQEN